jgi:hypothetical protein
VIFRCGYLLFFKNADMKKVIGYKELSNFGSALQFLLHSWIEGGDIRSWWGLKFHTNMLITKWDDDDDDDDDVEVLLLTALFFSTG